MTNVFPDYEVIAVQNYGPSGSLFLQSLLDGHPSLLATPALFNHRFYYFWKEHQQLASNPEALADAFCAVHRHWFEGGAEVHAHGLDQLGPNMDESIAASEDAFRASLLEMLQQYGVSRKSLFVSVYLAYACASGRNLASPHVIVFPIHSLPREHAEYLVEDFPRTKFVYTVREPQRNIASLTRHIFYNELAVNATECAYAQILNDYMKHWGNSRYVNGDRPFFATYAGASKAIRLEDLHGKPRATLEALCRWIGISWDDCLLQSTFGGKKWWNRPESVRWSGFGTPGASSDPTKAAKGFDSLRLSALLRHKYRRWQYAIPESANSTVLRLALPLLLLLPFQAEAGVLRHRFACTLARRAEHVTARLFSRLDRAGVRYPKGLANLSGTAAQWAVVLLFPFLLVRDYVMIRWWLYRAWLASSRSSGPEVELLPIAG